MTKKTKKYQTTFSTYLQLYKESDAPGKMVILSLLGQSFSKNDIRTYNCTKYTINLARKWRDTDQSTIYIFLKKGIYKALP